jgi:hypothetical protein
VHRKVNKKINQSLKNANNKIMQLSFRGIIFYLCKAVNRGIFVNLFNTFGGQDIYGIGVRSKVVGRTWRIVLTSRTWLMNTSNVSVILQPHTLTHTRTHTHIYANTHTRIFTHTDTHTHICKQTHTHTFKCFT